MGDSRQRGVGAVHIGRRAHEPHGDRLRTRKQPAALAGGRSGRCVRTAPLSTSSTARGPVGALREYPLGYPSGRWCWRADHARAGVPRGPLEYSLSFSPYADRSIEIYIYVHIYTCMRPHSMHTRVGTPSTESISGGLALHPRGDACMHVWSLLRGSPFSC
jgi:hypothetical protein